MFSRHPVGLSARLRGLVCFKSRTVTVNTRSLGKKACGKPSADFPTAAAATAPPAALPVAKPLKPHPQLRLKLLNQPHGGGKQLSVSSPNSNGVYDYMMDSKIATMRLWRFRLIMISVLLLILVMEEVILPAFRRPPRLDYGGKLLPGQSLQYRYVLLTSPRACHWIRINRGLPPCICHADAPSVISGRRLPVRTFI